jgi:hypothetical protein
MSTKARTAVVIQAALVLLAVGVGAGAAQAGTLEVFVGECPRDANCVTQPNRIVPIPNAAVCTELSKTFAFRVSGNSLWM